MIKRLATFVALLVLLTAFVIAPVSVTITATAPDGTLRTTQTAGANDDLTCNVGTQTRGYIFTWYQNGNKIWVGNPLTHAVRDSLSIVFQNNDQLSCVVSTANGFRVGSDTIIISTVPTVTILAPPDNTHFVEDTPITFVAEGTDPEGQPLTFTWNFGDSVTSTGTATTHTYTADGSMTVTATATDPDGNSASDTITLVITKRAFIIPSITTYEDRSFSIPATTFFRLSPIFVQFSVTDLQGSIVSGLDVEGFIQNTQTGQTLQLQPMADAVLRNGQLLTNSKGEVTVNGQGVGSYLMSLSQIPADDRVLGGNIVVVIAFRGLEGGQTSTPITILNNVPFFDPLPSVGLTPNTQSTPLDLDAFAFDLETPQTDLIFTSTQDADITATIDPATHELVFTSTNVEKCAPFTVTLDDTDGGLASQSINVCVVPVIQQGQNPVAVLTADQRHTLTGIPVSFDGSQSRDSDGTIVKYAFDFGDSSPTSSGLTTQTSHAYMLPGVYTATLTVTDNDGRTNTTSLVINVDWNTPNVGVVNEPSKQFRPGFPHDIQLSRIQLMPFKTSYKAGENIRLLFELRNRGSTNEKLQFRAFIPGLTDPLLADQTIANGDVRLNNEVMLSLPRTAKPGTYVLRVELTSPNGAVQIKKYFPITIMRG